MSRHYHKPQEFNMNYRSWGLHNDGLFNFLVLEGLDSDSVDGDFMGI